MYNPTPPQGYGYDNSPYGMQAPAASMNTLPGAEPGAKSSIGIAGNAAGALAYLGPFNIVFAIIEKDNRFVRFNAFQSLLAGLTLMVIDIGAAILAFVVSLIAFASETPAIALIVWILVYGVIMIGTLVFLILIIMAAIKAYNREMFKIPLVGSWAESIVRKL